MLSTALALSIAALVTAVVALVILEKRYRLLRRRILMLDIASRASSQMHRWQFSEHAQRQLAQVGRRPVRPIEFLSEFGEDLLLYQLFDAKPDGFFIECGAHDGFHGSVTYAFEAIGWTGLLVEPVPRTSEMARKLRSGSTVVQAVMSKRGSSGTIKFAEVVTGDRHQNATRSYVAGRNPPKQVTLSDKTVVRDIPVSTMDDALASLNPQSVDFAVIDVEGHEMDLFDGFDLERWKPRALMVEEYPPGRRPELMNHLASRGYVAVQSIGWNKLFVRRDDEAMMRRCRELQWLRDPI
ncbi:MAG TPA: FkbM family methyltransferase [Phycisphaerales bacterium]|nr:FkbM family methyltransferase [Phycisphaerales bacterium]